jgi:hypothetical protein
MKRPRFELFRILFNIAIISLFLLSCKKSDIQGKKFPNTLLEIEESVKNTEHIAKECALILDSAISIAYNQDGFIDPFEIAKSIELIDGVISAIPTASGTGIVVEQEDGTFSNLLIVTADNDMLFKEESQKSSDFFTKNDNNLTDDITMPSGSGKALILAPFQNHIGTDLDYISQHLKAAGYTVNLYLNSEATLERFNYYNSWISRRENRWRNCINTFVNWRGSYSK